MAAWDVGITEAGDAGLDGGWMPWVEEGRPAVLISKNPMGVLKKINRLKIEHPNVIVHCTITGFAGTALEPRTPTVERSIKAYTELIDSLGGARVVLRLDPVIPTSKGIDRALWVSQLAYDAVGPKGYRHRLSFLDNYRHNRAEFERLGMLDELDRTYRGHMHAPLKIREAAHEALGQPPTCAEPGFERWNVPCISEEDLDIFGVPEEFRRRQTKQRGDCGCLNKRELLTSREPCALDCIYCYWKH